MRTIYRLSFRFFSAVLIISTLACSKDDSITDLNPNQSNLTIEEVVARGNAFEDFATTTTPPEDIPGTQEMFSQNYTLNDTIDQWRCTRKKVSVSGGTGEFPLFNTNASVIFPGNLLQGKTLSQATPSDIVVKRAGGKITYNLVTGNPQATVEVDKIDQGTVNQAMNDVIAENGDITPANFVLDVTAIESKEQLALELGLTVSTLASKVNSNFSLNTSQEYSSVLIKLTQQYYTMSYVKPTSLDEVFDPSVTPEELARFIQPDNPATFISSVTYGRIFYMLYESTASAEDMKFALEGGYNTISNQASGSVDLNFLKEYNNLSVKVIAYGGDSEGTLNAIGATFVGEEAVTNHIQEIVERLAASSDIAGGLPLSYVVNSLEDPSQIVSTNLATEYDVVECVNISEGLPKYTNLRGSVDAALYAGINTQTWGEAVNSISNILFDKNGIFIHINDEGNTSGEYNLEDIGPSNIDYPFETDGISAAAFRPSGSDTSDGIYFFNTVGNKYSLYLINSVTARGVFLGVLNISSLGNDIPFSNIGAAMDVSIGGRKLLCLFNEEGTEYTIREGATFTSVRSIKDFQVKISGGSFEIPFDKVGAAMRVDLADENRTVLAIFDEPGTQYIFFDIDTDEFIGPFNM
jgi:thiol-activated cytolysin